MKTLCLVEDNQDNADLIRDLIGENYDLVCFSDGASALAALSRQEFLPSLFLLDISLPGMDGKLIVNTRIGYAVVAAKKRRYKDGQKEQLAAVHCVPIEA